MIMSWSAAGRRLLGSLMSRGSTKHWPPAGGLWASLSHPWRQRPRMERGPLQWHTTAALGSQPGPPEVPEDGATWADRVALLKIPCQSRRSMMGSSCIRHITFPRRLSRGLAKLLQEVPSTSYRISGHPYDNIGALRKGCDPTGRDTQRVPLRVGPALAQHCQPYHTGKRYNF